MILPTPRSTLFPYTTLFRSKQNWISGSLLCWWLVPRAVSKHSPDLISGNSYPRINQQNTSPSLIFLVKYPLFSDHFSWRSEEHTSELQSRPHLVCRLLLEKK